MDCQVKLQEEKKKLYNKLLRLKNAAARKAALSKDKQGDKPKAKKGASRKQQQQSARDERKEKRNSLFSWTLINFQKKNPHFHTFHLTS